MFSPLLSLEYAYKFWYNLSQEVKEHQRDVSKTYLWLNVALIAGLKAMPIHQDLYYIAVAMIFTSTASLILGCMSLSGLFTGSTYLPMDKFRSLYDELKEDDKSVKDILYDYDKVIANLKVQIARRGWLLRVQSILSIISLLLFFVLL